MTRMSLRLTLAAALAAGLAPQVLAAGGQGLTWSGVYGHANGVDHVGCAGCDPYVGDTSCKEVLPILCIIQDGSAVPPGITPDFYNGWAQGNIATTFPVSGTALTSQAVADQICAASFGTGWRMAEHHDGGGGWTWYAYGHVRTDMRYWTHINNQPGNCWNP